jgi:ABC-type Fe3+-siderophore transport system permease subunit
MAPEPASQHAHRVAAAAGTGVLLAGALGYVGLVDPHNTNSVYPLCPFRWLTGWNCPFCGGLRMAHDLLHGDLVASINDNIFLLVGIPMLAGWVLMRRRHGRAVLPIPAVVTITVAAIAWTVLRNLPGFPLVPTILSG